MNLRYLTILILIYYKTYNNKFEYNLLYYLFIRAKLYSEGIADFYKIK